MTGLPERRTDVSAQGEQGGEVTAFSDLTAERQMGLLKELVTQARNNQHQVAELERETESLRKELKEMFEQLIGRQVSMGGRTSFDIDRETRSWNNEQEEVPVTLLEIDGVEEAYSDDFGQEVFVIAHAPLPAGEEPDFKYVFEALSIEFSEPVESLSEKQV